MDSISCMVQRAKYFRTLDKNRNDETIIYFHDETWMNSGEEKTMIWFDSNIGHGPLKRHRLCISAMLGQHEFHLPTIDIFKCDSEHSMDGNHFVDWISRSSSFLRQEHGPHAKISIIIDNAPWHNQIIEETKAPKRFWNKQKIIDWLDSHEITHSTTATKAELLQDAIRNAPRKKYVVDEAAKVYDVDIVQLPAKHCTLNPVELAWTAMKSYVREHNTSFRLVDVQRLASEWIGDLDVASTKSYIAHVHQNELVFRRGDAYAEQIEETLIDDDNDDTDTVNNMNEESENESVNEP
ncbi:unnamed protein product [Rotaria sordida]|uniref:Tc1-like transposase DDE domain-containing protein n=1 Tax=Rotaria sordida TaxID=392033 RepID=A0A815UHE7_9BILA|nr:unnamed protein product [Rotaria sordida]CAF4214451.1 unnamed protein product [Rotaria sordida]